MTSNKPSLATVIVNGKWGDLLGALVGHKGMLDLNLVWYSDAM